MWRDLQLAFRQLRRTPGFTIAAALTLALGIGATTAVFSVADALLLRPLPYPHSERLVMVWDELAKICVKQHNLSANTYDAYRSADVFEATAAFREDTGTLLLADRAERIAILSPSPGLFEMSGARVVQGRGFQSEDWLPERNAVAILSASLFARTGASPGQTIRLANRVYTVIGVFAPGFDFGLRPEGADVWTPLPPVDDRGRSQFRMLARLRPGVPIEAAQAAVGAAARRFDETEHPYRGPNGEDAGYRATVISLRDQLFGSQRTGTRVLLGAVALLLLIACVNVANLLLARGASREREIAIRRALGASGGRLVRQCLTEAAVLAALGGAGGILLARAGVALLSALSPAQLPGYAAAALDSRALLFTLAVSTVVCLLFGPVAAVSVARVNWGARGSRPRHRAPGILIAAETALAVVLLVGAGLLLQSFLRLQHVDPGFRADHVLTMRVQLAGPRYQEARSRVAFFTGLRNRLATLPGAISASAVSLLLVAPIGDQASRAGNPFSIEGRAWDPSGSVPQIAHTQTVDLDYFRTLGIPLRAGRDFTESDTADATQVTVVNETLARRWFQGDGALGKRILIGAPHPGAHWMTIVGIVADIKSGALDQPPMPQFFAPVAQDAPSGMTIVLRSAADPRLLARDAIAMVHLQDPELPVYSVATAEDRIARSIGQPRYQGALSAFFAAMALLLAAVGVYGVVSHDTIRRTRETGIRMALGAQPANIIRRELTRGLRPVAAGAMVGLMGAAAASRYLASVLFGVTPFDPATFTAALAVLALAAAVACLVPARRAVLRDPLEALREE